MRGGLWGVGGVRGVCAEGSGSEGPGACDPVGGGHRDEVHGGKRAAGWYVYVCIAGRV